MNSKLKILLFAVLTAILISACKKDTVIYPSSIKLQIGFTHSVDGTILELDTIKYSNEAGNLYSVVNLRYFISNLVLHKAGEKIVLEDIHYIDLRDTNTLTLSPNVNILNGACDSITFTFGLDTSFNMTGYFVNPPEANMAWPPPMGGGYHYMQLEGKYDSAGVTTKNYNVHTGATMGVPYDFPVHLSSSSFMANGKNITATIEMNINKWFSDPNTYDFMTYGDAIMGNSSAQQVLQQNGHDVFRVISIK